MKHFLLIGFLLTGLTTATAQRVILRLMPEAGLSLPSADFKSKNVSAGQGFLAGLNADMFWGKFGLGLYGGMINNTLNYKDDLPLSSKLITNKTNRSTRDNWQQLLVGIGPILKFDISEKFDLELSTKFGFSKFTYPDYAEFIETGNPLNQQYTMYETRNKDVKDKLNLATIPAMKLSFKPTEKLSISLGANYTHAKGVEHSYRYLDGDFNPQMTNDELEIAIRTAPTNTQVWKCDFNSFGVTLGVGFVLGGGKDKPKEEKKEDEKMDPPIPQYPDDGSTITLEEADSLVLEWAKETPNVDKANYNLWLYEVRDSTERSDTLIYQTKVKRQQKFLLPEEVRLESGITYKWQVRALDAAELKPCPGDCYSIQIIFKVDRMIRHQYYKMLSKNSGNYIETKNAVRVTLPKNIQVGGKVKGRIINPLLKEVIVLEDLAPNQKSEKHEVDAYGQMAINIRGLSSGYYVLMLSNERKETFYFRFLIPQNDGTSIK